jgi:Sugar-transfer associated ATP-grasp
MLLDMSISDILACARKAKAQTGRPVLAQLAEIARMRRGPGKLSAREYFDYRIFDPALTDAERAAFVGRWVKGVVYQAQDQQWCGIGNDKLLAYLFLASIGLPTAPIRAVYHPQRHYPGAALLHSPEAFEIWLRDPGNYPFFAKPSAGAFGMGSCFAARLDAAADSIVTVNDERLPIADYATRNWDKHLGGLIVQQVIEPHPELVERIGRRVATARIVTMLTPTGPRIHRSVFRIPTGANFTDNFNLGSSGNGFAIVDPGTGKLTECYNGLGLGLRRIENHVDTGQRLEDYVLPHWQRAAEYVLLGQRAMTGLPILGWDVAFAADGPVIVEFNTHPGYAILQATGRGLADAEFLANFPRDSAESRRLHPHLNIGTGDRRRR